MTQKLQWRKDSGPSGDAVFFTGEIDETSGQSLKTIAAEIGSKVQLDTGEVRRINSLGVRSWIEFMKTLAGREVTFRRCAPVMVEQLNTVAGFRGKARVESVLAPYLCETCYGVFSEELVVGRDIHPSNPTKVPERQCAKCKKPMVFDDLPERYLQFMAY